MRNLIFALIFSLFISNTAHSGQNRDDCTKNCAAVTQTKNGYSIKVVGNAGEIVFHESARSSPANAKHNSTASYSTKVIELAYGVNLPASTRTTTTSTPLPGGGTVIVITTYVDGVIVSQTVIIVDRSGNVIEITDVEP